ncbi:hypothetical protein PFISCL1PPCAC_27973 [Pristionchus fissidentatus]|uniref:XK-related protein n=1 Tax=Pristionchus fissidentatus TaxID=1538716 RepID=A0AAV5WWC6_9BILA|nr:hypothetical protein PFISCL1PPCAC_27973 [Pristionchus fissidentatus]
MLFEKHRPKLIYFGREEAGGKLRRNDDVEDNTDSVPEVSRLRNFDLCFYAISMLTYVTDVVSDVVVAYTHYSENRIWSAILIAVFAFVPSLILNVVAFIWMSDEDEKRKRKGKWKKMRSIICILQGGPLLYYWRALRSGIRAKRAEDKKEKRRHFLNMIASERDATLLRFFEAFMESCPQLLIQGFLLSSIAWSHDARRQFDNKVYILCASVFFSLLSVAFSISNQHRTQRFARSDKLNLLVCESVIQLLWRFGTLLSRFLVLVVLCLARTYWIVPFFAIHYLISIMHIVALQSVSIGVDGSPTVETGLILINGCIHFFAPFNMAEGQTRWRYATAYGIEVIEAAITFYIAMSDNSFTFPYKFEFLCLSAISIAIGFAFMIIYYAIFHPTKRKYRASLGKSEETDEATKLKEDENRETNIDEIEDIDSEPLENQQK